MPLLPRVEIKVITKVTQIYGEYKIEMIIEEEI